MTFLEALKWLRSEEHEAKGYSVVRALAEQIEANRKAIEELIAERAAELQQRAECQAAFDKAMAEDPAVRQFLGG